ncbi:FecR family protein, partial [Pseudomonas aeruginosa]|uniref:FecR family protein n=1 Tax=Pseudomonas aeruginosa TaxID=287 RepID=UPI0024AF5D6A
PLPPPPPPPPRGGWRGGFPPASNRTGARENPPPAPPPDGSEVELDLKTRLSFANFRDIRRVVLDDGEAYFHVTHDTAHPFVVRAGKGSITVTGTRFNVWKYQDNVVV